ncbi:MAG: M48 family metallopeptidase [Gammaproteobacteria bacterium]
MHPFTALFLSLLAAGLAARLWLLRRQMRAVRASRERVPDAFAAAVTREQHARAADYTVAKARRAAVQISAGAIGLAALTVGGGIAAIDAAIRAQGFDGLAAQVATVAAAALTMLSVNLPFEAWGVFRTEARFGFNRMTPGLFLLDLMRSLAVSAVLFLPLIALLVWLQPRAGSGWWLWAWGTWAVFSVALSWLWPRVIAPLFNRFRELEPGELRTAVEQLARRCGFEPRGVRVMDGSRRSTHGNAYFTGIGRSKRIVLFDTLQGMLAPPEVQAVLAHELGHYRLRHIAWALVGSLAASFAGFAALGWLARQDWFQPALGIADGGPHTLLLLFVLAAPVFLLPLRPVFAWFSRRNEYAADAFAARHAAASDLASALVKLHRDNAVTLTPDPLYTAFHAAHPPVIDRIARLSTSAAP